MTKTAGISKGMAQWIEDFVAGLNQDKLNKKADNEQIDTNVTPSVEPQAETPCDPTTDETTVDYFNNDKTAAINVYDLPKVVWNDETFYVLFDEETGKATILNQFTNVVTTVQASTIEEVDDALNGLQIVTSEERDLELKTADVIEDQETPMEDVEPEIDESQDDDIINQIKSQIDSLTEQITILKQQYARVEELQNLDLGLEELEVQHFNETANETAQQIQDDNSKDITTPEGRSSLRDRLLNDIDEVIDEIPSDNSLDNTMVDTDTDDIEVSTDESDDLEDDNIAEPLVFDAPSIIDEQMYMEDTNGQENKLDDFSNNEDLEESHDEHEHKEESHHKHEEKNHHEEDEEEFEILNGKDANIFKKAVCPCCGGDLVKANLVKSFQGIICKGDCHSEYAVNLDNETIFRRRGEK